MGVEDKKVPSREILQGKLRALVAQMSAPIDRFGVVGILEENAKKVCPQPSVRRARTLLIINDFDLTGKILQPGLAMSSPRADAGRISSDPSMAEAAGVDEYLIVPGTGHWPDSMIKYRLDLTLSVPDGKSGVVDQVVEIETSRHAFSFDFSGNDFRPVSLTLRQRNLVSRFQWQTSRMLNYQEETVDKRVVTELTSGFAHGILSGRDVVNQTVARTEKPAQVSTPVRPSSPNETPRITPVYKAPEASSGRKEGNEAGERHMEKAAEYLLQVLRGPIDYTGALKIVGGVLIRKLPDYHISRGRAQLASQLADIAQIEAENWIDTFVPNDKKPQLIERLKKAFVDRLSKSGVDYLVTTEAAKGWTKDARRRNLRYSLDLNLDSKTDQRREQLRVSTYIQCPIQGEPSPILSLTADDEVLLTWGKLTESTGNKDAIDEMASIRAGQFKVCKANFSAFPQLVGYPVYDIFAIYACYLAHCVRRGFEPFAFWKAGPAPMIPYTGLPGGSLGPYAGLPGESLMGPLRRAQRDRDIRDYIKDGQPYPSEWREDTGSGPPQWWLERYGSLEDWERDHSPLDL